MIKEAVILAGGQGTRLRSVINKLPKPMAPVNGKPFLEHLLGYLKNSGIKRVIVSVGYKAEIVSEYFGDRFLGMDIKYAVEKEPLGTGGAILYAAQRIKANNFFLLNGDTFFNLKLKELFDFHTHYKFDISLSLKKMFNVERYGVVEVEDNKIQSFKDKMFCKEGFINGGVYLLNKEILDSIEFPAKFSFEDEFLKLYPEKIQIGAYLSDAYFIDIGIPEDYEKAKKELTSKSFY